MSDGEKPAAGSARRITPYDVVFGGAGFDQARFELLREQAASFGATRPSELLLLPAAGELLRELLPDDDGRDHGELAAQTGALLFHAFRYWLHGQQVYEIAEPLLRPLLQGGAEPRDWEFVAPVPSGYLQLPQRLLWARVAEEAAPEPVDGFFWSTAAAPARSGPACLDLLLALGVRPGRPGISLVELAVEGEPPLQQWAAVHARPDGTDFANILPGGELQGYHSLTTQAEVLKLAALCFLLLQTARVEPLAPEPDGGAQRYLVHG
jgi:hypothetical protein